MDTHGCIERYVKSRSPKPRGDTEDGSRFRKAGLLPETLLQLLEVAHARSVMQVIAQMRKVEPGPWSVVVYKGVERAN
ncbi:MAG: hypothetical protein QOE90_2375 [Thermoplasmata archaeon]|nr:hypothetical protein [Thermoplasmata archaeon]